MQQPDLDPEGSRHSESRLAGCLTARTDAPAELGEVGHAPASPLASVRQHLRRISAQSLSGFSDASGTASSGGGARGGYLVNTGAAPPFLQGSVPASSPDSAGTGMQWGRAGEGYHEEQGFSLGKLVPACAVVGLTREQGPACMRHTGASTLRGCADP